MFCYISSNVLHYGEPEVRHYEVGDIEDIVTAAKGCPLLISATTEDAWSRGAQEVFDNIKAKGKSDVELKLYAGGHIFTNEMREYA